MKGTTLKLGATAIDMVTSADVMLSIDNTMIDATELLSAAMQSEPGLPDFGTMEAKGNWDPGNASHAAMLAASAPASAATAFAGTLANSSETTIVTTGPIKSFKVTGGGPNELAKWEMVQKVNGYVLTPAPA